MDASPFSDPRVLIPLGLAIITLIAWFVRLEAKNQATAVEAARLEREFNDLWKEFETHRLNQDIHFNLRVSNQVEQGNERRFLTIERQLTEINTKLDRMAEKK